MSKKNEQNKVQEQAKEQAQEQAQEQNKGTAFDTIINAMFGKLSDTLPNEVRQGVKDPVKTLAIVSTNSKGEGVETQIHNVADIDCIGRINAASAMGEVSSLVIAANLSALWENGAYDRYDVKSAEGLAKALGLNLSAQVARKMMKVGQRFLSVDDKGQPVYKTEVPHFGVYTLDYLCSLVDDVTDESGKLTGFDYSRLNAWVIENDVTERLSQARVRALLPDKESKKSTKSTKDTKGDKGTKDKTEDAGEGADDGTTETIDTTSPAYILVKARESLSAVLALNGDSVHFSPEDVEKIGDVTNILGEMLKFFETEA